MEVYNTKNTICSMAYNVGFVTKCKGYKKKILFMLHYIYLHLFNTNRNISPLQLYKCFFYWIPEFCIYCSMGCRIWNMEVFMNLIAFMFWVCYPKQKIIFPSPKKFKLNFCHQHRKTSLVISERKYVANFFSPLELYYSHFRPSDFRF